VGSCDVCSTSFDCLFVSPRSLKRTTFIIEFYLFRVLCSFFLVEDYCLLSTLWTPGERLRLVLSYFGVTWMSWSVENFFLPFSPAFFFFFELPPFYDGLTSPL